MCLHSINHNALRGLRNLHNFGAEVSVEDAEGLRPSTPAYCSEGVPSLHGILNTQGSKNFVSLIYGYHHETVKSEVYPYKIGI